MSDVSAWPDVVTTALLGTTRRPLPADAADPAGPDDPAVRLLDLAARHRVLAVAGHPRTGASPPEEPRDPAPPQDAASAPAAAEEVLAELLAAADPALIGTWLDLCVRHGVTVAPVHWTPLARLAARSTHYDRTLLGRALGARGRWFLRQNPDWRRLSTDAEGAPGDASPAPPPTADQLAAEPELLFGQPDPWSVELVGAAYAIVGSLAYGPRTRSFAAGVGVRLPPEHYATIAAAAAYYLERPGASPAVRRLVRDSFVAMERAAYVRTEIAAAFDPTAVSPTRVEIPRV